MNLVNELIQDFTFIMSKRGKMDDRKELYTAIVCILHGKAIPERMVDIIWAHHKDNALTATAITTKMNDYNYNIFNHSNNKLQLVK